MEEDRGALILSVFSCPSRPLLEVSLLIERPPAPVPPPWRQRVAVGFWFEMLSCLCLSLHNCRTRLMIVCPDVRMWKEFGGSVNHCFQYQT